MAGDDEGEESWEALWRRRKADANVSKDDDEFVAAVRQMLAKVRQQLSAARAEADKAAYNARREVAAVTRDAEEERLSLAAKHRKELEELQKDLRERERGREGERDKGAEVGMGVDVSELTQRLRMAKEEVEGAHEAARVADAAANAAERRVRELEKERHEEFLGYLNPKL
jgi:Xaa-Pro aminopeptidase